MTLTSILYINKAYNLLLLLLCSDICIVTIKITFNSIFSMYYYIYIYLIKNKVSIFSVCLGRKFPILFSTKQCSYTSVCLN